VSKRKRDRQTTFAEIVEETASLGPIASESGTYPMGKEWVDETGRVWRAVRMPSKRRQMTRQIEHLILDASVSVQHWYGPGSPHEIPATAREAFWDSIRPYVMGLVDVRLDDPTDFVAVAYRDEAGATIVHVSEFC
jgi:hypothetical protein